MEKSKPIIGGIFGTRTEWDENGNVITQDEFHLRIYWDLWHSGAIKKLKGNMLHVYLTIAMHLDKRGEGWPTQQRIAELCGINRDTVGTAIKKLVQEGFIEAEKIRGADGKFDNTVYKIKFAPQPSENDHAEKSDMVKMPENQGSDHAEKFRTDTMRKKPARKNRHGKSDTKKELMDKEEQILKEEPKEQQQKEEPKQEETKQAVVVETIQYAWKQTFDEEISQVKARLLLEDAGQDETKVLEAIKKVAENLEAETPIAAVRYELRVGWDFSKKQQPKKSDKYSGLPKAVAEQLRAKEEQAAGSVLPEEEPEEDFDEIRARIQAKIKLLNEKLSARYKQEKTV